MDDPVQVSTFPTPHRLHWMRPRGSRLDLLYLAWGHRFYGQKPSPHVPATAWGWHVIRRGNPILRWGLKEFPVGANDVFVFAPGCVQSLWDVSDRQSNVLVWQWEAPPACEACIPPRKGLLRWKASPGVVRRLEQIHAECRQEVFYSDQFTPLALKHLRLALEVALARSRGAGISVLSQEGPCALAVRWMREHLEVANPVHHICDYLQVSPSTLRRAFLDGLGRSPAAFFQQLKMERAREMLRQMSVKEVAYQLGYHYPNDFSKAFKEHFGTNPTASFAQRRGSVARGRGA
ncbi:MAG: helix-turn-helix transcriptional regulator [Verrucomicrobiae bacterium]|nr:helix-turn-helix transcriptional regulator [Verrucomicrobiae bacterium]